MLNKQTLKVEDQHSEKIVSVMESGTSYVDNAYYRGSMGEDRNNEEYKNYPVNVYALKLDWIINDGDGLRFLKAMLKSEHLEIYECPTIIIIVEYLYGHYGRYILLYRFPFYVAQLAVFYATILLHEKTDRTGAVATLADTVAVLNLASTGYTVFMMYLVLKHTGTTVFRSY